MSKAPKTAPKAEMKLHRFSVRVVEANRSLAFNTKAATMTELRAAIDGSPSPRVILNTEEYGPAMIHRDHIILITKEPDATA